MSIQFLRHQKQVRRVWSVLAEEVKWMGPQEDCVLQQSTDGLELGRNRVEAEQKLRDYLRAHTGLLAGADWANAV